MVLIGWQWPRMAPPGILQVNGSIPLLSTCHYEESIDALIRSQRAADMDVAHDIENAWRDAVLAKGFEEIR